MRDDLRDLQRSIESVQYRLEVAANAQTSYSREVWLQRAQQALNDASSILQGRLGQPQSPAQSAGTTG